MEKPSLDEELQENQCESLAAAYFIKTYRYVKGPFSINICGILEVLRVAMRRGYEIGFANGVDHAAKEVGGILDRNPSPSWRPAVPPGRNYRERQDSKRQGQRWMKRLEKMPPETRVYVLGLIRSQYPD
jgi:hypothetical protein